MNGAILNQPHKQEGSLAKNDRLGKRGGGQPLAANHLTAGAERRKKVGKKGHLSGESRCGGTARWRKRNLRTPITGGGEGIAFSGREGFEAQKGVLKKAYTMI